MEPLKMEPLKVEKWGTKLTIKFLKKYHEHRCLWDFNDSEYKNRIARTKALEDIVATMELNNFDTKSANIKIKALRSTYLHEKRKIRKHTKNGFNYKPKLAWYPLADSFLRNYVMEKFCIMGNVPDEETQPKELPVPEDFSVNDCNTVHLKDNPHLTNTTASKQKTCIPATNFTHQRTKRSLQQQEQQQEQQSAETDPPATKKNKPIITANHIQTSISNPGEVAENCRPNVTNLCLSQSQYKDNDEFGAFASSVAAQMRTLPLDIAYEVQLQIQCLITQTKLKVLGRHIESNNSSASRIWDQFGLNTENYSNQGSSSEVKVETTNDVSQNQNQQASTSETSNSNFYNISDRFNSRLQDPGASGSEVEIEDYLE